MSDTPEIEPTTEGEPTGAALRERGDKAEAKATAAETRVAELERELALTTAGVPNEGTGALFRKAYDGELTEEAIAASMLEYGVIVTGGSSEPQTAPPPEGAEVTMAAVSQGLTQEVTDTGAAVEQELIQGLRALTSQADVISAVREAGLLYEDEKDRDFRALPEQLQP